MEGPEQGSRETATGTPTERRFKLELRPLGSGGDACEKCGFAGADPASHAPDDDWREYVWIDPVSARRALGRGFDDVLLVACRRCNFRWIELPRDVAAAEVTN